MLPKGLGLSVAKAESQHSISFIPLWLSTLKLFTAKQFVFSYIHKAVSLVEHEENSWKRKKTRKKYVKTKKRIPLKLEGHFYSNSLWFTTFLAREAGDSFVRTQDKHSVTLHFDSTQWYYRRSSKRRWTSLTWNSLFYRKSLVDWELETFN